MCLTSTGGLPIFNRNFGDIESVSKLLQPPAALSSCLITDSCCSSLRPQLPFSTVGSLNGIHMFCKSQGATLHSTHLDDGSLVMWREFHNAITLIALTRADATVAAAAAAAAAVASVANNATTPTAAVCGGPATSATATCCPVAERVVADLLELVFGAMVLAVGLEELRSNENADQLKRELKPIYGHIDTLLAAVDDDLLRYSECVLSSEGTQHLERLNEFSARVETSFCCLLVHDKVIVGTDGWWALHALDRKLLLITVRQQANGSLDVPVYLPRKSPNVAFRWVVMQVWQNVRVGVICGATPRYEDIERLVRSTWSKQEQVLVEAAEMSWHRNVPPSMPFSQGILGFILINRRHGKYVIAQNVHQTINTRKRASTSGHRLDILRSFFHQTVDADEVGMTVFPTAMAANRARSIEAYWCSDYHKCHAYAFEEYLLCVLYFAAIPTHIMRLTTQKTLNTIISEKGTTW